MLIVNRKSAFYLKSSPAEPNFFHSLPMGIIFLKMCPCCFPGIFGFIAFYKHNKTPSELDGWSNNYTSWVVKMHKSETSIFSVMLMKPITVVQYGAGLILEYTRVCSRSYFSCFLDAFIATQRFCLPMETCDLITWAALDLVDHTPTELPFITFHSICN